MIKKNIKALAKERGLSMKNICDSMEISDRTFRHRLSSDETITVAFLKQISTILNCSIIDLIKEQP